MTNLSLTTAWLTVNRRCNFRCKWCYAAATGYKSNQEMRLGLAETLTNVAFDVGIRQLVIIGGEPTLWRWLISFNKFCANLGMRTVLVTNGFRFHEDKFWAEYQESAPHFYEIFG